jgi:hypothetical protein
VDLQFIPAPYVIVGAVATSLYMPRRETRDIDILIQRKDSGRVVRALREAHFTQTGDLSIGGSSWLGPSGEELDVLESDEEWVSEALAHPRFAPSGEPVAALPYLVLLKLKSSRPIDYGDLQRMLGQADDVALDEVRRVIRRYLPEDVEDLESLIVLGKLELQ